MSKQRLIMLIIIVFALMVRLYHIDTVPAGFQSSEAGFVNDLSRGLSQHYFNLYDPTTDYGGLMYHLAALDVRVFGTSLVALRILTAFLGVLTILGLYLLTRRLFNWQIAVFASALMAMSFWHILLSRIVDQTILLPLLVVWGLYLLWQAVTRSSFWYFFMAGVVFGLGLYTSLVLYWVFAMIVIVLLGYWWVIALSFNHQKYLHIRNHIGRGLVLMVMVILLVGLPILMYFYSNPEDFVAGWNLITTWPRGHVLTQLLHTVGLFNFVGDMRWAVNIPGQPMLFWPVGILFAAGFLRGLVKLFKTQRKHGHFSAPYFLLYTWFFVGLMPVFLSPVAYDSLRAVLVLPVAFIFAGEGLWWLYELIEKWYQAIDHEHLRFFHRSYIKESTIIASSVIIIFLLALAVNECRLYFVQWATDRHVALVYNQDLLPAALRLNDISADVRKYIINNNSLTAESLMLLTQTVTPLQRQARNFIYLSPAQASSAHITPGDFVLRLD